MSSNDKNTKKFATNRRRKICYKTLFVHNGAKDCTKYFASVRKMLLFKIFLYLCASNT